MTNRQSRENCCLFEKKGKGGGVQLSGPTSLPPRRQVRATRSANREEEGIFRGCSGFACRNRICIVRLIGIRNLQKCNGGYMVFLRKFLVNRLHKSMEIVFIAAITANESSAKNKYANDTLIVIFSLTFPQVDFATKLIWAVFLLGRHTPSLISHRTIKVKLKKATSIIEGQRRENTTLRICVSISNRSLRDSVTEVFEEQVEGTPCLHTNESLKYMGSQTPERMEGGNRALSDRRKYGGSVNVAFDRDCLIPFYIHPKLMNGN
ncbi:hypothetical protein CDAR_220111 [Caerostris darwini]|uniref:Uncharacterized protein n=1 Tax=Caerostris darwini TaxID=1538125 RepID=A0AAV4VHE9_9ARAC|nr:hypothetical protein CDAR_220111 [Caerostris darwini]